MSAPAVTSSQLLAVVERARKKAGPDRPIIVRADPSQVREIQYEAENVSVVVSQSPLEIRSLLSNRTPGMLVVLTDCHHHELGDDLMARVAGNRVWPIDRWETVKELFSARNVSSDLARKRYLADALIEARPLAGYSPVRSGVIDTDTALSALLQEFLKIPQDLDTLDGFVQWAMQRDAPHRLAGTRSEVAKDLHQFLVERYGSGTEVVLAILGSGKGDDLIPLGLVGHAIHDAGAPDAVEARVRLEYEVGDMPLESEAWRHFGAAAERLVLAHDDRQEAAAWQAQGDVLLSELNAEHLAFLSDLMPMGLAQRVQRAGEALTVWYSAVDDLAASATALDAIESVNRHDRSEASRVQRMRMAARLIRRGTGPLEWGNRLGEAALTYQADGAWMDWARVLISRGESDPGLSALYGQLTAKLDESREGDNQRFATFGSSLASTLPSDVIGIEHVMTDVVAPVAAERPVLVIVLDGMGWPSFLEVHRAVSTLGWTWWTDDDGSYRRPVMAVLPTVTEFSRTSLFAGTVRKGTGESERRAFHDHEALGKVSKPGKPPVLHHKAALRRGGLDSVPAELLADVGDLQRQVVAVVLNNIDERLKDVVAPPEGWDLPELDPLRWLLQKAHEAGRVVVLTADHGHIIDRDATQVTAPGGGERWKPVDQGVADGEIEVSGPRVVGSTGSAGDRVVLPWVEQRRYATRRNGYHGGITPQEVLVPLAVLSVDDLGDSWRPVLFSAPAWWHHRPAIEAVVAQPKPKPATKTAASPAPSLFDEVASEEGSWLDRVLDGLRPLRTPLIRLTDEEIRAMLAVLDQHGGMAVSESRMAEVSGLPVARIGRYVSQLQQLVNIDGYGVVTAAGREVRFDRALLERQLGLS